MRVGTVWHWVLVGTLSLVFVAACTQASKSSSAEEFFKGKTITWVISSTAGSTSDLMARIVAPYLAKAVGGTGKVDAMGNDVGVNYVYTEAKRDGLTLVVNNSTALIGNDILQSPGVLYESDKFQYLASLDPSGSVFQISPNLPYKSLEALRQAKGLKGGGTTAKGSLSTSSVVMAEILGLDAKVISGYNGKRNLTLAVGRGEIDYMAPPDNQAKQEQDDGFVINLFSMNKERSPVVPEVPTMFELGVKVPKEMEAAHKFISTGGFAVALPPDVPPERVEFLRKAIQKLNDDVSLREEIGKLTGIWRPFQSGKELQDDVAAIKANKELTTQLDALISKYKASN